MWDLAPGRDPLVGLSIPELEARVRGSPSPRTEAEEAEVQCAVRALAFLRRTRTM